MQRRDALVDRLTLRFGTCDLMGTSSGTHLIWHLPDQLPDAHTCQTRAAAAGISVYTIQIDTVSGADMLSDWDRYLLMGYTDLQPEAISLAIDRFAALLA